MAPPHGLGPQPAGRGHPVSSPRRRVPAGEEHWARSLPNLGDSRRCSCDLARISPKSADEAQICHKVAKHGNEFRSNFARSWTLWACFGEVWPTLSKCWPNVDQIWPSLARLWPGHARPKLAQSGPAGVCPNVSRIRGRLQAEFGRSRIRVGSRLVDFSPASISIGPSAGDSGQMLRSAARDCQSGPLWRDKVGRLRNDFGRNSSKSGELAPRWSVGGTWAAPDWNDYKSGTMREKRADCWPRSERSFSSGSVGGQTSIARNLPPRAQGCATSRKAAFLVDNLRSAGPLAQLDGSRACMWTSRHPPALHDTRMKDARALTFGALARLYAWASCGAARLVGHELS